MSFAFRHHPRRQAVERTHAPSLATRVAIFTAHAINWTPKAPPSRMSTSARVASRIRPTRRARRWTQLALPWGVA